MTDEPCCTLRQGHAGWLDCPTHNAEILQRIQLIHKVSEWLYKQDFIGRLWLADYTANVETVADAIEDLINDQNGLVPSAQKDSYPLRTELGVGRSLFCAASTLAGATSVIGTNASLFRLTLSSAAFWVEPHSTTSGATEFRSPRTA